MIGAGYGRLAAAVAVFGISAFFHELVISIALHTVKLWAFSAMLLQVMCLQLLLVMHLCMRIHVNVQY